MTAHSNGTTIDARDPRIIVVYEGDDDMQPADYRAVLSHWVARLDAYEQGTQTTRFGVMMIHGHHEHDEEEEHEHERNAENEAEIVKMFNDFRRDERDRISAICTGFANVYDAAVIPAWYGTLEAGLERLQDYWDRFSQYNFGIPSTVFTDIESARSWLLELPTTATPLNPPPVAESPAPVTIPTATRVGLFYGSTTGYTEYVAESLVELWQKAGQAPLEAINITDLDSVSQFLEYDKLILGIPTWNIGELQDDWEIVLPRLKDLDFTGKQVALFGVGDARGYPDNFLDAMGMLGNAVRARGATLVGYWSIEGYDFDESLGVENGQFMGLGIDEMSQSKLTAPRLVAWIEQVIREFALEPVPS